MFIYLNVYVKVNMF